MKISKLYFLSFLFLFVLAVSAYSQTVRYVAYFPVPYISHMTLNADTAYFAGKDNASVSVTGNLSAENLRTEKDLELNSTTNTAGNVQALNVNTGADIRDGSLVVNRVSGQLALTNVPTPESTGAVNADTIEADDSLQIGEVKWVKNNTENYNGFVASTSTSFGSAEFTEAPGMPLNTKRLCWKPLRLKGSYEYQYYLIAVDTTTCP